MPKRQIVSLKHITIVHGKSELDLCKCINTCLKLKHVIVARDKGAHSIQVGSVMDELNSTHFKSLRALLRKYDDLDKDNFKIFIIMDLDDCKDESERMAYISGAMFAQHWAKEHIIPIYNYVDLEETLKRAGYPVIKDKGKDYVRIFPTNTGKTAKKEDIKTLREKIGRVSERWTNLNHYIDYCLNLAEENSIPK